MTSDERKAALRQIAGAAVASERETGCPALLTAAQCILESGWLKVSPGNNCFGIKDTDRYPGCHYSFTKEYVNGQWQTCRLAFESYPTLAACFVDHGNLIMRGKAYQKAISEYRISPNLDRLVTRIAPIYATDPAYGPKILSLMRNLEVRAALTDARTGGGESAVPFIAS